MRQLHKPGSVRVQRAFDMGVIGFVDLDVAILLLAPNTY